MEDGREDGLMLGPEDSAGSQVEGIGWLWMEGEEVLVGGRSP